MAPGSSPYSGRVIPLQGLVRTEANENETVAVAAAASAVVVAAAAGVDA